MNEIFSFGFSQPKWVTVVPMASGVKKHHDKAVDRVTGTGSGTDVPSPEIKLISGRKSATVSRKLADSLAYPPRLLRSDRAAAYLSMSESHFLKLVEQGRLPRPKRLGSITFWDRVLLDAFVDSYEGEDDEVAIDAKWTKMLGASNEN